MKRRRPRWLDALALEMSFRQTRGLWEASSLLDQTWEERKRRAMAAQWFKVTDPEGHHVWLNPDQCYRVRPPTDAEGKGTKTVIDVGGGFQRVTEDMETVMRILRKC